VSDLPNWVLDLVADLLDEEDTHPPLFRRAIGSDGYVRYEWCPANALVRVPNEAKVAAQVIQRHRRDYPDPSYYRRVHTPNGERVVYLPPGGELQTGWTDLGPYLDLKGWAADGSRLCQVDIRRLSENPVKAADLHGELELVLKAAGSGERASSKPGSGTPPRDAVVDMRAEIRHVLVSWAKLIGEERGVSLPADEVSAIGAYVARHAEWLAATEYAGEAADELAGLVSRAWGLAYPSGTRKVEVGGCPRCDGTLTAIVRPVDSTKTTEVVCDGEQAHRWDSTQLRTLDRLVMARKRAAA
jgi:hypothetical protein